VGGKGNDYEQNTRECRSAVRYCIYMRPIFEIKEKALGTAHTNQESSYRILAHTRARNKGSRELNLI
jgi:hypothetical protein